MANTPIRTLSSQLPKHCKTLRLILGDQLNASHSWFRKKDDEIVYLIAEVNEEHQYVKHHVQKICAFFLAMQQFAQALANAGHQVIYLTLDETKEYASFAELIAALNTAHAFKNFEYQQPDEYRLSEQISQLASEFKHSKVYSNEHFYLTQEDINEEFKQGEHTTMEFFYRRMRKRFGILVENNKPIGGRWNFDQNNRNKLKEADLKDIPEPLVFDNDVSDILERLQAHSVSYFGKESKQLIWPVTRRQARQLLTFFCQHQLVHFGRFQDAMTQASDYAWSIYHSRLSFALNSKILSPKEVIERVLEHWQDNPSIDIAQVEGFIRQILGWREYVRGIYWRNMPEYAEKNALQASHPLPDYFWNGKTQMNCLRQCLTQSLDYSYAHHIQRLMVIGNFCLLFGIDPDQVDEWYLGVYIDAIEWVEMPNTRGMTQFADNGIVATKPYAASSNYINKMSDYCKHCSYTQSKKVGDKSCPLNSAYWHFIYRHREKFESNPRMSMVYRTWQKMEDKQQQAILEQADDYIANLNRL